MFNSNTPPETSETTNRARFKELLVEVYTIQEQCKATKEMYFGVFDPRYEQPQSAGFNADIIKLNQNLIQRQESLLVEVRKLKMLFSVEEHNKIVLEAQAEANGIAPVALGKTF